ncbi:MAG: hypothetical protein R3A13_04455 [Bdellovibrionota bacterium]
MLGQTYYEIKRLLLGAFFLFYLFPSNPLLAETLTTSVSSHKLTDFISCSTEQSRAVEVKIKDKSYLTIVPQIAETPIVNSTTVCKKFLAEWINILSKTSEKKLSLSLELNQERTDEKTYYLKFPEFFSACRELGFCMDQPLDYFSLNPALKKCQPVQTFKSVLDRMMPRFRKPSFKEIKKVKIHTFPFVPLVEKLNEYMKRSSGVVYASTMSLGEGTATKMYMDYKKSNSKLIVALDAGVTLSSGQGHMLGTYFFQHPSIYAIPMTSGHDFKTIYHWKLLADPETDTSLISSMNLSTPLKTPYIDLVYEFENYPEVKNELLNRYHQAMSIQCDRAADFACLSDFSESDQRAKDRLKLSLSRACKEINNYSPPEKTSDSFFMEPHTDDVEELAIKHINQAKKEIILLTHKFSLPAVYEALEAAKKRGSSVSVFSSESPPYAAI